MAGLYDYPQQNVEPTYIDPFGGRSLRQAPTQQDAYQQESGLEQVQERASPLGIVKRGARSAVSSMLAGSNHYLADAMESFGLGDLSQGRRQAAGEYEYEAAVSKPRVSSFEEAQKTGEYGKLAQYYLGAGAPSITAAAVGGVTGRKLGARMMGAGATQNQLLAPTLAGATAPNFFPMAGELSSEMYHNKELQDDPWKRLGLATGSGLAQAAVEAVPEAAAIGRIAKGGKFGWKNVPGEVLKTSTGEGVEELAQNVIGRGVYKYGVNENKDLLPGQNEAIDTFLSGMVPGAAFGGVTSAARAFAAPKEEGEKQDPSVATGKALGGFAADVANFVETSRVRSATSKVMQGGPSNSFGTTINDDGEVEQFEQEDKPLGNAFTDLSKRGKRVGSALTELDSMLDEVGLEDGSAVRNTILGFAHARRMADHDETNLSNLQGKIADEKQLLETLLNTKTDPANARTHGDAIRTQMAKIKKLEDGEKKLAAIFPTTKSGLEQYKVFNSDLGDKALKVALGSIVDPDQKRAVAALVQNITQQKHKNKLVERSDKIVAAYNKRNERVKPVLKRAGEEYVRLADLEAKAAKNVKHDGDEKRYLRGVVDQLQPELSKQAFETLKIKIKKGEVSSREDLRTALAVRAVHSAGTAGKTYTDNQVNNLARRIMGVTAPIDRINKPLSKPGGAASDLGKAGLTPAETRAGATFTSDGGAITTHPMRGKRMQSATKASIGESGFGTNIRREYPTVNETAENIEDVEERRKYLQGAFTNVRDDVQTDLGESTKRFSKLFGAQFSDVERLLDEHSAAFAERQALLDQEKDPVKQKDIAKQTGIDTLIETILDTHGVKEGRSTIHRELKEHYYNRTFATMATNVREDDLESIAHLFNTAAKGMPFRVIKTHNAYDDAEHIPLNETKDLFNDDGSLVDNAKETVTKLGKKYKASESDLDGAEVEAKDDEAFLYALSQLESQGVITPEQQAELAVTLNKKEFTDQKGIFNLGKVDLGKSGIKWPETIQGILDKISKGATSVAELGKVEAAKIMHNILLQSGVTNQMHKIGDVTEVTPKYTFRDLRSLITDYAGKGVLSISDIATQRDRKVEDVAADIARTEKRIDKQFDQMTVKVAGEGFTFGKVREALGSFGLKQDEVYKKLDRLYKKNAGKSVNNGLNALVEGYPEGARAFVKGYYEGLVRRWKMENDAKVVNDLAAKMVGDNPTGQDYTAQIADVVRQMFEAQKGKTIVKYGERKVSPAQSGGLSTTIEQQVLVDVMNDIVEEIGDLKRIIDRLKSKMGTENTADDDTKWRSDLKILEKQYKQMRDSGADPKELGKVGSKLLSLRQKQDFEGDFNTLTQDLTKLESQTEYLEALKGMQDDWFVADDFSLGYSTTTNDVADQDIGAAADETVEGDEGVTNEQTEEDEDTVNDDVRETTAPKKVKNISDITPAHVQLLAQREAEIANDARSFHVAAGWHKAQLEDALTKGKSFIIDFETTGLDPDNDHIVEIAVLEIIDGKATGNVWTSLLKTSRPFNDEKFSASVMKDMHESGATDRKAELQEMLDFIGADPRLIAHNGVTFDFKLFQNELLRSGLQVPTFTGIDTLLAKRAYNPALSSRVADYAVGESHRAVGDVQSTLNMINTFREKQVDSSKAPTGWVTTRASRERTPQEQRLVAMTLLRKQDATGKFTAEQVAKLEEALALATQRDMMLSSFDAPVIGAPISPRRGGKPVTGTYKRETTKVPSVPFMQEPADTASEQKWMEQGRLGKSNAAGTLDQAAWKKQAEARNKKAPKAEFESEPIERQPAPLQTAETLTNKIDSILDQFGDEDIKYSFGVGKDKDKVDADARATIWEHFQAVFAGTKVQLDQEAFNKLGEHGEHGSFYKGVIRIFGGASSPVNTYYHEALHALLSVVDKQTRDYLIKVAQLPFIRNQVIKYFEDMKASTSDENAKKQFNAALADIRNKPEEALTYAAELYYQGKLDLNTKPARTILGALWNWIKSVAGVMPREEVLGQFLTQFKAGKLNASQLAVIARGDPGTAMFNKMADRLESVGELWSIMWESSADRITDFGNESASAIVSLVNDRATDGGHGFIRARDAIRNKALNELDNALSQYTPEQRDAALKEVYDGEAKSEAAKALRNWLDTSEIGQFGQNPMVYDDQYIQENPEQWAEFQRNHVIMKDRKGDDGVLRTGNEVMDVLIDMGLAADQHDPLYEAFEIEKNEDAYEAARQFMQTDFVMWAGSLISSHATKKANQDVFGAGAKGLRELLTQAQRDLRPDQMVEIADWLVAAEGRAAYNMSKPVRDAMSNIIAYTNMLVLPFVTLTSIIDVVNVAARTGNLDDAFTTFQEGMGGIVNSIAGGSRSDAMKFAEAVNVLEGTLAESVLAEMHSGLATTPFAKRTSRAFFKWNLMHGWSRGVRSGAAAIGRDFLLENILAKDYEAVAEFGMTKPDTDLLYAKIVDSYNILDKAGMFNENKKFNQAKKSELDLVNLEQAMMNMKAAVSTIQFRSALTTFVDKTIIRPTVSTNTKWMNDPRFALLAQLKRFTFAYSNTMLPYVEKEILVKGNYAPAMTLLLMGVPIMMASDWLRDVITPGVSVAKENMSTAEYLLHETNRTGLLGRGTFGYDMAKNAEYGGSGVESFLGPTIGTAARAVKTTVAGDFIKGASYLVPGHQLWVGLL